MKYSKSVVEYLESNPQWEKELTRLISIVRETGLEETIKWGAPTYTFKGKNIVGLGAFKSYVGLWFHQGALLADPEKKLINAQEGTTKALRQWRFNSMEEIDNELIKSYVFEAIENQDKGKEIKASNKGEVQIPTELVEAFEKDLQLRYKFEEFSQFKQREFAEYVNEAKRDATKQSRVEKIIPMILEGIGLNDMYRKS
jgi:uncharacterized protein YdeI (YjbR/CyaY-like superfamily)